MLSLFALLISYLRKNRRTDDLDKFFRNDLMHLARGVKRVVPHAVFITPIGGILEAELCWMIEDRRKYTGDIVNFCYCPGMALKEFFHDGLQATVPKNDSAVQVGANRNLCHSYT